jgi:RND family efflux transporter MFP subunit
MSEPPAVLSPARPARSRRPVFLAAAVLLVIAGFLAGYLPRRLARARLAAATPAAPVAPRLSVVKAVAVDAGQVLTLPAGLVPNQQTMVYARASGYVNRWLADIGDRVKKDQLLLQLDTPELDKQLAQACASLSQARAALAQAQANRELADITALREANLFAKQLISAQENDQARTQAKSWGANVDAAAANVVAQHASVGQLEQLVSFGRVIAPYDGTITRRMVDVGTLVDAGAAGKGAALFEIVSTDPMKAFVEVPQVFAPSVRAGAVAKVAVRNFRGRLFQGKVARTAGVLDAASRTLHTEVDLPNPAGELFAGMFVDVSLDVAVTHQVVRVPSSAIIADSRGLHVAVVDGTGKVHLVAVTTGLDDGTDVDVVTGLSGGEQVIAAPPSGVADGFQVEAVSAG